MGRLSAIFIAFCMVLIAGSVGVVAWLSFGFTGMEATVLAIAVLTALVMVNSVTGRQRDRSDIGGQIADLSRGTADIGRQVSELDRRIVGLEGDVAAAVDHSRAATEPLASEIDELGRTGEGTGRRGRGARADARKRDPQRDARHAAPRSSPGARAGSPRRAERPDATDRAELGEPEKPTARADQRPLQGHGAVGDRRARSRARSKPIASTCSSSRSSRCRSARCATTRR